jgi:hypothetical protein
LRQRRQPLAGRRAAEEDHVCIFVIFLKNIFGYRLFMFIMLFNTCMFELHMVVVVCVMFHILELIMDFFPNYLAIKKSSCRQFYELTISLWMILPMHRD